MKGLGHYGTAMLLYSPILFIFTTQGFILIGLTGLFTVFILSRIPDVDYYIPFITHRGVTHTVWFAILIGFLVSIPFDSMGSIYMFDERISYRLIVFVHGLFSIITHLIGDSLTPTGVRPFMPFKMTNYSLALVKSNDYIWNIVFLIIGALSTILAIFVGRIPFPTLINWI